jgi:hypothetical protein
MHENNYFITTEMCNEALFAFGAELQMDFGSYMACYYSEKGWGAFRFCLFPDKAPRGCQASCTCINL